MSKGLVIAGRYELEGQLGQGGMGSVWRARHLELGYPIAIKLVDPALAQTPEALSRFKAEARAAASLRGAHVVSLLDYGVDGDTPYIAMELLEGESLRSRLDREGKLPAAEVLSILRQVAKAIDRAHTAQIVHRDLKPENIFLAQEGRDIVTKVLDFGIAKELALENAASSQTKTGTLLGTPYYMSPEQASGRKTVDHRSDIWAIGVIAYECSTGRRPFEDETIGGLVLSICTEEATPASQTGQLPLAFDDWYRRSTAKDPRARFQSVLDQIEALGVALGAAPKSEALAATETGEALQSTTIDPAVSPTLPSRNPPRRPPTSHLLLAVLAAALVLAALGLLLVRSLRPSRGEDLPFRTREIPQGEQTSKSQEIPDEVEKSETPGEPHETPAGEPDSPASAPPGASEPPPDRPGKQPLPSTKPAPRPSSSSGPPQEPVLVPKGISVP
jgi:serine/threonine-protein kinase